MENIAAVLVFAAVAIAFCGIWAYLSWDARRSAKKLRERQYRENELRQRAAESMSARHESLRSELKVKPHQPMTGVLAARKPTVATTFNFEAARQFSR